jgi:hypothetical protein
VSESKNSSAKTGWFGDNLYSYQLNSLSPKDLPVDILFGHDQCSTAMKLVFLSFRAGEEEWVMLRFDYFRSGAITDIYG